jgi:cobalt/nickel transport system permease protein
MAERFYLHLSEGILSGPVLVSGAALAAVGTGIGLKSLDYDRIARAGILSASFFVASLVHVPIGPSSIHLILNGVVGLLLGWGAVPAILVALLLQAVLFQFGGITTLGINTVIMAAPAVVVYHAFGSMAKRTDLLGLVGAFCVGFWSVLLSGVIAAAALVLTGEGFVAVAALILSAHLPVMVIEGIVTLFCVVFLRKVQPSLLAGSKQKTL